MLTQAVKVSLILALLVLGSCGFHLRGTGDNAFSLTDIHVNATNVYGEMQRELERALVEAGANIVDLSSAPYAVRLLTERTSRRAVATTSQNAVAEYEVRLEVTFTLVDSAGEVVIPDTIAFAERIYTFDNASLVGNSQQETLLTGEMRAEVASQLIRRIDATLRSRAR